MNVRPLTQRHVPDNTQHTQYAYVHSPGWVRTRNPYKRATVDSRLRTRGHQDRRYATLLSVKIGQHWRTRHIKTRFLCTVLEHGSLNCSSEQQILKIPYTFWGINELSYKIGVCRLYRRRCARAKPPACPLIRMSCSQILRGFSIFTATWGCLHCAVDGPWVTWMRVKCRRIECSAVVMAMRSALYRNDALGFLTVLTTFPVCTGDNSLLLNSQG